MDPTQLDNNFRYHPADTKVKQDAHEGVRASCRFLAEELNNNLPDGREKALAITKLEECMFWANASLAREV